MSQPVCDAYYRWLLDNVIDDSWDDDELYKADTRENRERFMQEALEKGW